MFLKAKYPIAYILLKLVVPTVLMNNLPFWPGLILSIVSIVYRYIIGYFSGITPVPGLELLTLYNDDKEYQNVASIIRFSGNCSGEFEPYMRKQIAQHPKMHSRITRVYGDYYYKEISPEDAYKICCKQLPKACMTSDEELCKWLQEEIAKKIPLNTPQWRYYWFDDFKKGKSVSIWISHHSLADGLSCMGLTLQYDDVYDTNKLIKFPKANFFMRWLVRLQLLWTIPAMIFETVQVKQEISVLNDGVRNLSGRKEIAHTQEMDFNIIKDASKNLGFTINELFTAAISVGVKKYMITRNDNATDLQMVIPGTVRWEFYPTYESVKLENKFAAFPVKIPLEENHEKAIFKVKKATNKIKTGFTKMYASYIMSLTFGVFVPEHIWKLLMHRASIPYTLAFSNVPGVIKPIVFKGYEIENVKSFIIPGGATGIGLSALSFSGKFMLTMSADLALHVNVKELLTYIEDAVMEYIEISKKGALKQNKKND